MHAFIHLLPQYFPTLGWQPHGGQKCDVKMAVWPWSITGPYIKRATIRTDSHTYGQFRHLTQFSCYLNIITVNLQKKTMVTSQSCDPICYSCKSSISRIASD